MKILIQCNYDPQNLGGIEMVTQTLLEVLTSRNFDIEVMAGTDSDAIEERTGYRFRGLKILRKISGVVILRWGNWRFLRAGLRSDVIMFQEPFPTLLPSLFLLRFVFRKRVFVLVHAIPHMPKALAGPYARLRRTLFARVPVVATTPILLEQLELPRNTPYPRDVISLCFGDAFTDPGPSPSLNDADDLPILPQRYMLFFGRLASYKGIEILMPAIRAAPEVNFVIAGAGVLSAEVSTFINKHGLENVVFINRSVSDAEKLNLINHCYAFLLPSTNSSEAFAITQIEAMHFGKPIINTQLNNGVNFVAPANDVALTVPPRDADALAAAIRRLWSDEALANELGSRGKERKERLFSRSEFERKWLTYFDLISHSEKNDPTFRSEH